MRYIHRGFQHPGGVSPMKQEDLVFPSQTIPIGEQVEKEEEKKKTTKKKKEEVFRENLDKNILNKESESSEPMSTGDKVDLALMTAGLTPVWGVFPDAANVIQNTGQAIFNAVSGDFKEAKHDATNAMWAVGAFIPAGIGQWFAAAKLAKNTAKLTKTGSKVTADFLNNATEAQIKSSKLLTNTQKVEILNARVNTKLAKEAAEGGVVNGIKYYKGATHYGKIGGTGADFNRITNEVYSGLRQTGKVTDNALAKMNFNVATDLTPQNVTKIGTQNNRAIFEVSYPDGSKQRFWRSTSLGGKTVKLADGSVVSSKGFFGTVAGHMDVADGAAPLLNGGKAVKGWFIKHTDDWMGYGSKTYEETGAVLKKFFESGLIN